MLLQMAKKSFSKECIQDLSRPFIGLQGIPAWINVVKRVKINNVVAGLPCTVHGVVQSRASTSSRQPFCSH